MLNNPEIFVVNSPSFRYAAVQQIMGVAELTSLTEADGRSTPAMVYPMPGDIEGWIVEAPATSVQAAAEPKAFTGNGSLLKALEHAHSTYCSVIYLSR